MIYKLQPCLVCQKEISNQARECPHCGHPTIRGMKLAYDNQLIPYTIAMIVIMDMLIRWDMGGKEYRWVAPCIFLMVWLVGGQLNKHCENVFGMDDDPYDNPFRRWRRFRARMATWRLPAIKWRGIRLPQRPARNRRVARNTRQRAR